ELATPLAALAQAVRSGDDVSDLGWLIDPTGLEFEIFELSQRYDKPMVITENGVADQTDAKRQQYLLAHLLAIRHAREAGYDVRGYFHWTLADDFEWTAGYGPKYGLYTVDSATKALVPKPSADFYRFLIASRLMEPGGDAPTGQDLLTSL